MRIELSLERIAIALEKIARKGNFKQVDIEYPVAKPKAKPKKKEKKDIPIEKIKKAVKEVKVSKKLTAEDVKVEARKLVDGTGDRKGFEKAQQILKKLGVSSLKELMPEKFAEAINEFSKAIINFKADDHYYYH